MRAIAIFIKFEKNMKKFEVLLNMRTHKIILLGMIYSIHIALLTYFYDIGIANLLNRSSK